jgi:hypothetical protein
MNSSVFLASLEANREVRAATRTTGGPNGIFPDIKVDIKGIFDYWDHGSPDCVTL